MELVGMGKIENYRCGRYGGMSRDGGHGRDCGVVDACSQYYRSYLRAVRWLAEECDKYYDDSQYGMDRIIKDVMLGRIAPNNDDYVILVPLHGQDRHFMSPGIRVEEKTARLIREVQRDFDLQNDAKYFGQFKTACGKSLDQVRQQFYIDCFSECVHPQSSRMKANTTECVPVPSSEHVAEIVGKKGKRISVYNLPSLSAHVGLARCRPPASSRRFARSVVCRPAAAAAARTPAGKSKMAAPCGRPAMPMRAAGRRTKGLAGSGAVGAGTTWARPPPGRPSCPVWGHPVNGSRPSGWCCFCRRLMGLRVNSCRDA